MAVEMQSAFILPQKFEKLRFTDYVSEDTMSTPSTPSSEPGSPPIEPYNIKIITNNDEPIVLDHLRRFFFRDEPLNVNVKLLEKEDSTCLELESYSVKSLKEGNSMMAITDSGAVIGVCLNSSQRRDDPEKSNECRDPKFSKILTLLDAVDKQADVFDKFPEVDKMMNVLILSVDGAWRGKGIAKELMDRTRDLAREQGYGLMRVDCTSNYSARAIARLGFDCIYTLKYEDYKINGRPVFTPHHPHNSVTVYTQKIS